MTDKVINFSDYKKRLDPDIQHAKILAKKIVDAYRKHGENAYFRAILSATGGNNETWEFLRPYVEEAAKVRP